MFSEKDLQQIAAKGIKIETIETQLENFRTGFPFVKLVAPATPGNGIVVLAEEQVDSLRMLFDKYIEDLDIKKFVPASGAASRMFKHLHEFHQQYRNTEEDHIKLQEDKSFNSVYNFFSRIRDFAFYEDLDKIMAANGLDLAKCLNEKDYNTIIDYLLEDKGLDYANLPKGLLKFHNYHDGSRMSIEEHLVESAEYCRDKNGRVAIHFTVSPEHMDLFRENIDRVKGKYEDKLNVEFDITYSIQKPSTDTIAVDMENEPFRDNGDTLLFRPGGHGALIENLNDIENGFVFVKNIDNIVTDKLREPTYLYKKALGGYLLYLREETFSYLNKLADKKVSEHDIEEAADFATNELCIDIVKNFKDLDREEKRQFLINKLNRPIRVCGMVKNEGEPGGGPFWVISPKGEITLQIVEKSQIDMNDHGQADILKQSTHFNPVDLVCSVKDFRGNSFNLKEYIDPSTGFISTKSKDGKNLKAQELPGLWNGAMAEWITVFVETPIITFNPVKTINDLLRDTHQ